jgi:hypothetical protein
MSIDLATFGPMMQRDHAALADLLRPHNTSSALLLLARAIVDAEIDMSVLCATVAFMMTQAEIEATDRLTQPFAGP